MASANKSPEEYQKKIWKILSSDKTMDNMKEVLVNDEGFKNYFENGIKENLKQIVGDEGTKSYEDIFTQFGGLDPSEVGDDNLDTLIKKAVKANMGSIAPDTKEAIFTKWDEQINKNRKQKKN